MIVYDLDCAEGHRFEGWFADSAAFTAQRDQDQIACPYCGTVRVERAVSAPRIAAGTTDDDKAGVVRKLAALQQAMLAGSTWVGDDFATRARAMHDGDEVPATIHGRTTLAEAKSLHDDGVKVTPLPFPVVPPEQQN
jgi:hypothetical protein